MTTKKILGSPQANLPTMRVAARAIHWFGPMSSEDLRERLRPREYFDEPSSAIDETLTVADWLGLLHEDDSAQPKLKLGSELSNADSWFNSPSEFALTVLQRLFSEPKGTEIAELIPWFLAQDWRREVDWSHDEFARERIMNPTQANAFFDRWMVPLGLAKMSGKSPDPMKTISWLLPSLSGRYSGVAFVDRLGASLPTGPGHRLALALAVNEDAPQPGEVFSSVAFALLQLERSGRIRLIRADDAAGRDRLIFRNLADGGYTNVTHVEVDNA